MRKDREIAEKVNITKREVKLKGMTSRKRQNIEMSVSRLEIIRSLKIGQKT